MAVRKKRQLTYEELRVREWITSHRKILTLLAVKCNCSPQFVQQVAYGRSTALPGHKVEKALRDAGWPGIRRRI